MKFNPELIIFDLDGTLYNLDDVVSLNYRMQVEFYMKQTGCSKLETISLFEENRIFPEMRKESKSATEFFAKKGLSMEIWNKFRENNFDVKYIQRENAVRGELMARFKELAPLVLLSSNSCNNIHNILDHIKISDSLFDEIVCSDNCHCGQPFTKIKEMKSLGDRREVKQTQMLSIGDRYNTDIEPIIQLGGRGVQILKPNSLYRVFEDLQNEKLADCSDYSFFPS